ncbi:MAG: penicillin-binding protein activator [Candidatus Marinimicrobia bacterium]|nr:penicillin-binding protein activator [Candidatus Neomarinimicrobiota bacterium]
MKKIIITIFILISFSFANNIVKNDVDKAIQMYQSGNYFDALKKLEKTIDINNIENDQYSSTALFMMIKCKYQLNNYNSAISSCRLFDEYFPASKYLADIYFIRAQILVREENFVMAMFPALEAKSLTNELTFANDINNFILKTSNDYLTEKDLINIASLTKTEGQYLYIKLLLIEKYINNGKFDIAKKSVAEAEKQIDKMGFADKVYLGKLKTQLKTSKSAKINIGIVLPLTGANSIPGTQLLNGIKIALDKLKSKISTDIDLIILDSESDTKIAIKQTQKLSKMKNCIAVIGPLSSETAVAMSPVCNINKLPMITPTATETGLGNMGEYIFQLSPDKDERGYSIANYAIKKLDLNQFITIAPANDYGKNIINSFSTTVEKNNGKIIENIWYKGTPKDIRNQFDRIIEVDSLTYEFINNDSLLIDSLQKIIAENDTLLRDSIYSINSIDALEKHFSYHDRSFSFFSKIDSIKKIIRTNPRDNSILTIKNKTGLYLAIQQDDIKYIAPQIAKYDFQLQFLGDANWFDTYILDKYGKHVDNIIFISDHLWLEGKESNKKIIETFKKVTNKAPTRVELYGYDTIQILLNLIEIGNNNRELLREELSKLHNFDGPIRKINFTERKPRVNTAINFLQYRNNKIVILDDVE